MTEYEAYKIHCFSTSNRSLLMLANGCVCFYCKDRFLFEDIKEWIPDYTAICPKCGIDSVVPNAELITNCLLNEMSEFWFANNKKCT